MPNSFYQIYYAVALDVVLMLSVVQTLTHTFSAPEFVMFQGALDFCMKQLKVSGNFEIKKAETITNDIERMLWDKGCLGGSNF